MTRASPTGRPFVLLNMAASADGKIATANRAIHSFGSPRDHAHLYELRATADAVLCGAATAAVPGTTLDAGGERYRKRRIAQGLAPEPIAVIVSGSGSLPPDADVLRTPTAGSRIIVLVGRHAPATAVRDLRAAGALVRICPGTPSNLDLRDALRWLAREHGIRRLVAEGGAAFNDTLFRADLVDELHLTLCPSLVGGRLAPTVVEGLGVAALKDARRFAAPEVRRKGGELFLVFRRTTA